MVCFGTSKHHLYFLLVSKRAEGPEQSSLQFLSACISVRDLIGNLMGGKDVAILQKVSFVALFARTPTQSADTPNLQLCDSFEVGLFAELNETIDSNVSSIPAFRVQDLLLTMHMNTRSTGPSRRSIIVCVF